MSPEVAASMMRQRQSLRPQKSPLSCRDKSQVGGTQDNPLIVEEAPSQVAQGSSRRAKLSEKVSLFLFLLIICFVVVLYVVLLEN